MGGEVIGKRQPCPWHRHGTMRERERERVSSHSQITNTTNPKRNKQKPIPKA